MIFNVALVILDFFVGKNLAFVISLRLPFEYIEQKVTRILHGNKKLRKTSIISGTTKEEQKFLHLFVNNTLGYTMDNK